MIARRVGVRIGLAMAVTIFAMSASGCVAQRHAVAVDRHGVSPGYAPAARVGSAMQALAKLPVKGRAPMTGYSRDRFGEAWTDDTRAPWGHNGCDTRDDILRRDLTRITLAGDGCTVEAGVLHDPYTGRTIHFTRGEATSEAVQIDHVAALGDAWQTGAQQLNPATRQALANDPLNLIAVDGPTNEQKSDSDAASWLPPDKAFRCAYVARQVAVKRDYHLWVTAAEAAAISRVLRTCPGQPLPTAADALHRPNAPALAPRPRVRPRQTSAGPANPRAVYYPNCDAVRAAGKAPLHRGQPGYRPALDGDGDGLACE